MRKIIHIDMDAFFAQVEQRDHPQLCGLPVAVGGSPEGRGVVAAASYEARVYGVRSAMSMAKARRLCPQLHIQPADFAAYKAVSRQLQGIFARYTPLIEPLSLDEAYLDVSENLLHEPSATRVAQAIRASVWEELQLTCSAGVAPCKLVAKIASDVHKPNGLCVVPPDRVADFLRDLPLRRLPGIGPATEARLQQRGLHTVADLRAADDATLEALFGRFAETMRQRAQGIDERPVIPERQRKSVGIEDTFAHDLDQPQAIDQQLARLSEGLEQRRARCAALGRTLTLKLRYHDFTTITRSCSRTQPITGSTAILALARELLTRTDAPSRPVRLLGLSLSSLQEAGHGQQLALRFAGETY